jgi:arylsulfatase A-like enzyme
MVAATDAALAPLLDQVRASGQPTLVVVTGDHGEETHELFAYESTLRIPLIVAEVGADTQKQYVASGFSRTSGKVSHVSPRRCLARRCCPSNGGGGR